MANLGNINVGTGGGLFIGTVNINNLDASNNALLYSSDGKRVQGLNNIKYDSSNNGLNFSGIDINTSTNINASGDITIFNYIGQYLDTVSVLLLIGLDDTSNITTLVNYK